MSKIFIFCWRFVVNSLVRQLNQDGKYTLMHIPYRHQQRRQENEERKKKQNYKNDGDH